MHIFPDMEQEVTGPLQRHISDIGAQKKDDLLAALAPVERFQHLEIIAL